jgi:hypothetical protein
VTERGSITKRVARLEREVQGLKGELAAERLKALKRDVRDGVEQIDRGEAAPFDASYYQRIIDEARAKKSA